MNFTEYRFLIEAYKSDVEIHRNTDLEKRINDHLTNEKIATAHTRAFTTDHLAKQNIHVLRFQSHQHNGIEYHIDNNHQMPSPDTKVDRKSMTHLMTIIRKDATEKLNDGKRVVIQSIHPEQHEHYKNLANRLAKDTGRVATDVGLKKLTSAPMQAHTIVIEHTHIDKLAFLKEHSEKVAPKLLLTEAMLTLPEYSVL